MTDTERRMRLARLNLFIALRALQRSAVKLAAVRSSLPSAI